MAHTQPWRVGRILALLVVIVLYTGSQLSPVWAAPPYFGFAIRAGSTGDDAGLSVAIDAAGNVYVTGLFRGTVDFDPGSGVVNLTSAGGSDAFVAKYAASGALLWAKKVGGADDDIGQDIAIDSANNVYTVGTFRSTVDFDPGGGTFNLTSAGGADIFIFKLTSSGSFVWAKAMGGAAAGEYGRGIAVDSVGSVYTTGYLYSATADFDPGAGTYNLTNTGTCNIFVSKLDSNGSFVWAGAMNGGSDGYGYDIAVDGQGNVYVSSSFRDTVDFDPGSGTANLTGQWYDIAVIKLDSNRNLVWAKKMGGSDQDEGLGIAVDGQGNVYTTGINYNNTADFDPGPGVFNMTSQLYDVFISKLDSNGNFVWAKKLGGPASEKGWSIAIDAGGYVYTTGVFEGTVDFNPGSGTFNLTSAGTRDVFISKLDSDGNFVWAGAMGEPGENDTTDISVGENGDIWTTGRFQGTADFDPDTGTANLTSAGGTDVFLSKLTQPLASFSSASLAFGDQMVGTTSAARSVILQNTGSAPLTIGSITASGDFGQTNTCPTSPSTLAAGGSCTIDVTFSPGVTGSRSGTLTVTSNAASSPHTVALSGAGTAPGVSLSASNLAFGEQMVGTTSAARSVTMQNTGSAPLTIGSITASGDFGQTNTCPTSPSTLAAGGSCTIDVTFSPGVTGSRSGTLTVTSNAASSPHTVALSGAGTAPGVSLSASNLAFGEQMVGTTSVARSVTLQNTGSAPLTIGSITASGDFGQINTCPTSPSTLAAGGSCTIDVTFSPSVTGSRNGTLTVASNAASSPDSVALSGTGTTPRVSLSSSNLAFGDQMVGTTSAARSVTLQNTGSGPLTISSITASGDFGQTNTCPTSPSTLAAGSSCTIDVTFSPGVTGSRSGTLTVTSNAASSPHTVALSGTGTPPSSGDGYEDDDDCVRARIISANGSKQLHNLHQTADADWVRFSASAGMTYLIEAQIPADSPADVVLELYNQCDGTPQDSQDHAFSPGVRMMFQATTNGPLYLKLLNHNPAVYGTNVAYQLSVSALDSAPTPGAVVIVAGKLKDKDDLQPNIHYVTNAVYRLFLGRGYGHDRITYLATDGSLDPDGNGAPDVDGQPSRANLQQAITAWAADKVGPERAFTLYLMDHGGYDKFYLNGSNQTVSPGDLDGWLNVLEAAAPGVKVNIVIEACKSGSFIDLAQTVSQAGRVVISSTSQNWDAYASAQGAAFSDPFLQALESGMSLYGSFEEARWAVEAEDRGQTPWLDDDGDGLANEGDDGAAAAQRGFGYLGTLGSVWSPWVVWVRIGEAQGSRGVIKAEVRDDGQVAEVWAVVYPPSYQPPASGEELVLEDLPRVTLTDGDGDEVYVGTYDGFTEAGTYRVVVYAVDEEGLVGRPEGAELYRLYLPLVQR